MIKGIVTPTTGDTPGTFGAKKPSALKIIDEIAIANDRFMPPTCSAFGGASCVKIGDRGAIITHGFAVARQVRLDAAPPVRKQAAFLFQSARGLLSFRLVAAQFQIAQLLFDAPNVG